MDGLIVGAMLLQKDRREIKIQADTIFFVCALSIVMISKNYLESTQTRTHTKKNNKNKVYINK